MKHTLPVTIILVLVFLASQILGLALITNGAAVSRNDQGVVSVAHTDPLTGETQEPIGVNAIFAIIIAIAIATAILLVLIKFHLLNVWRVWFFLAVTVASSYALASVLPVVVAVIIAVALAAWKIWRPNVIIHNLSEVLIYSGIALAVVPLFSAVWYAAVVLLIIAVYDMYAVWHSKHMVAMANFQTESKLFAGLYVPYTRPAESAKSGTSTKETSKISAVSTSAKSTKTKVKGVPASPAPVPMQGTSRGAILGGGDVAFPLLYSGVVADSLLQQGLTKLQAFGYSMIVVGCATVALFLLFMFAKKDRFYPAMPFIAAGCFVGSGLLWLILR